MQEENKIKKSFFQNLKAELKKVIWPTGKQVVKNTFATIVFVLLITFILGIFNLAFDFLKGKWFNLLFPEESSNASEMSTELGETTGDEVLELTPSEEESQSEENQEESNTEGESAETQNVEESVVTE